jgi:hypothetical protein
LRGTIRWLSKLEVDWATDDTFEEVEDLFFFDDEVGERS